MIDQNVLFRQWLLRSPELVALLPDREQTKSIYAGDLPQGVNPADGPAVTFFCRGGKSETDTPIIHPSIQVRVWAGINQIVLAHRVYGVLHDYIHGKNNITVDNYGTVMSCLCSVLGYDVTDPDTSWQTVVSFYELMARE